MHLKALETYHLVFTRIGPARLARDLPLYAGGLFPLFSHCSTSLKAPLLSLYEVHFLPLGVALCPVLDGFVLAVLPGVEDESSEFYSRSRKLLDRLATAVDEVGIFARSLWRALLLSPPVRLSAAHYLRSNLAGGDTALRAEMVSDMPLVAYAITAALSDNNALTQRGVLDLLLGELALDSEFFQNNGSDEREAAVAVVGGVFGTLIRRDMSLTKRVHAWLLGGKESAEGIDFCSRFSNDLVLAAIDNEFTVLLGDLSGKNSSFATRPCRIAAALMDRAELSECLGHHFALRILRYGREAIVRIEQQHERDIRYAISELLQDLGSARVFAELERMLASERTKTYEDFELLTFALSLFPTKNDVVRKKHLPALLRVAVQSLSAVSPDNRTLDKAVAFCSRAILAMGLSRVGRIDDEVSMNLKAAVSSFASFFVAWLAQVVEMAPVELRRAYQDVSLSEEYTAELRMAGVCERRLECISLAKSACSFFVTAALSGVGGSDSLRSSLQATAKCASAADVRISLAGARAFAEVAANASSRMSWDNGDDEQIVSVIRRCWRHMHPSLRTATPQSAQALLGLQRRFPEETKNVIADGILSTDSSRRLRNLERFACLWRLAVEHRLSPLPADNGLFLMLDALTDEDWAPKMLARSWLSDALEVDASSVVDAPLRLLLTVEAKTNGPQHEFGSVYDAPRALYGFQVLRGILESCTTMDGSAREKGFDLQSPSQLTRRDGKRGRTGIHALGATAPSARTAQVLSTVFASPARDSLPDEALRKKLSTEGPVPLSQLLPAHNYVIIIALTCLGYLRGRVPRRFGHATKDWGGESGEVNRDPASPSSSLDIDGDEYAFLMAGLGFKSLTELHAGVCAAAAECLATLFRAIPVPGQMSASVSNLFAEPVLALVCRYVESGDPVLQLHFLNSIAFLVVADGPSFLSSFQGKEAFTKPETSRLRLSYSESQNQLQSFKQPQQSPRGVQIGSLETMGQFIPWLLDGLSASCQATNVDRDNGSHEVLGVRRRWIQFIESVMRHVGVTLPIVTEGLLLMLNGLLLAQTENASSERYTGDSEFSRVDGTLVLLEGMAVVASNVLWSFEYALATSELRDESPSGFIPNTDRVPPTHGTSRTMDTFTSVKSDGNPSSLQLGNGRQEDTNLPQNGHGPPSDQGEPVSNVTATTAAVMNAINPLRMINDFVKDVLGGSGSEGAQRLLDPRRSGARLLFCLFPALLKSIAYVWEPSEEIDASEHIAPRTGSDAPPRLSTELPRERRQAQRASVLAIVEPIYELRPTDVVSAIVALASEDQDEFGSIKQGEGGVMMSQTACDILQALDDVTPDAVLSATKTIFDKAVKWDSSNTEAKDGRVQASFRQKASNAVASIMRGGSASVSEEDLKAIGRMAPGENSVSLPGGTSGLELVQGLYTGFNGSGPAHGGLFHAGDFFAAYSPGRIETACFNFLDLYLSSCRDVANLQNCFPSVHGFLKEGLTAAKRRGTVLAILRVFGSLASKCPAPFPDRRYRRDMMTLSVSVISVCSSIASASVDVTAAEIDGSTKDFKRLLSVVALHTLAVNVPVLVDSSFLDDKPQLSSTVSTALVPAISALKKAAGRASSMHVAAESSRRARLSHGSQSQKSKLDATVDILASKAATDMLLQVSKRDWGVKFARRDLLVLMEDPNFFFAKHDGVLKKMSAIVREVVTGGGAAAVLTSIGSTTANGAPGIPSLFAGRDSETVLRARAIRRVAFCVFVSEPDFYSPQLPSVLERLRDALRMADSALVVECLLCLRALLLRIGPTAISAFRATTLSEMFRIASNPTEDLNATIAALKFLDLITLLSPMDYGYERCFFFGEYNLPDIVPGSGLRPFKPLALRLSALWIPEKKGVEEIFKAPFRLERGRTVLPGNPPQNVDKEFVGRYAAALMQRNSMPQMRAITVDTDTICREFEAEFLR